MLPDQGGRRAGLQELRYRDEEAVPLQGRDQLRHPQAAGNDDVDVNDDENDDDVGARGDAQAQDQVVEAEGRQELQGTYSILSMYVYVYLSIFIKCCITQNYLIILKINFWLRKQRACKNQLVLLVLGIGYNWYIFRNTYTVII